MDILVLFNALPGAVAQGLIWGIMAIGVYITFRILDLADLTVDGTMCTGGAVCIVCMTHGMNVWLAMLIAVCAGLIAGAVTGIFHTKLGIPAILAGILTQLGLYSINLRIMGGKANMAISVDKYDLLVSLRFVKNVPFIQNTIFKVVILTAILIAILYWFFATEVGASIRATGSNEKMARAQGINTDMNKVLGLMVSNGIVAFASALYAQYQGFADVNAGRGAIVIGLAAVIIGQVVFGKFSEKLAFSLATVAAGAIIYYIVLQVVLWLGLNSNDLKLLSALVVAAFLAVPHLKQQHFSKPKKAKGGKA